MKYITMIILAVLLAGADECRNEYTYAGLPAEGKKACSARTDYERSCIVNGQLYTCIREPGETEFQCARAVSQ